MKAITFKDKVQIQVSAGNGGNGCVAFRREKYEPYGGPAGGDGGPGGDVYLLASKDVDSLLDLYYQPLQRAEHGDHGQGKQCTGRSGADLHIRVPCGTQAFNLETGDFLGEVIHDKDSLLLAKGGRGGWGNMHFATPSHQAPRESRPGEKGVSLKVRLELKVVADIGLVGYPNAGKSSLLSQLTGARPKIAPYPFTTLNPVIGTLQFDDFKTLRIADIPGLIDGAHEGVGLGHDFLRHIERSRFLLFVIDMAGVDGRHPADDHRNLRNELKWYSAELESRPALVVANKMDIPESRERLNEFIARTGITPHQVSAETGDGISTLKDRLYNHFHGASADA